MTPGLRHSAGYEQAIVREDTRNKGEHVLLTGGRFDSHLLVSVIR